MFKHIILTAAFLGASALSAHAASLTNGSFELPGTFNGQFATYGANPNDTSRVQGWTIGGSGIDLINTYWTASDGNYSIDLSATNAGSVSQTVTNLVVGVTYEILFDLSGNPARGGGNRTLTASIGTTSDTYAFDTIQQGSSLSDMKWVTEALTFKATTTSALLTFASTTNNATGPALDNVRIQQVTGVPLPASALLLLGGLGAVAAARRRRG